MEDANGPMAMGGGALAMTSGSHFHKEVNLSSIFYGS